MKTSMISRTWRGTVAIAMALTAASSMMGAVPTMAASKDDGNVNITINKKDGLDLNDIIQNTGEVMSQFNNQDPVNNAGFTVYDVSEYFYGLYDGHNGDKLYDDLQDNWQSILAANATKITTAKSEQTTTGNGQTTFNDLAIKTTYQGKERNAIYVIAETSTVDNMTPALPMVVAMPVYKTAVGEDGEKVVNRDIQLYPKNYGIDKILIGDDGKAVDEENMHTYEVGKNLTYQAKFVIPADIGRTVKNADGDDVSFYKTFTVEDAMTQIGATFKGITSMTIGTTDVLAELGPAAGTDVSFTSTLDDATKNAAWKLDYAINTATMRNTLNQYAGKTLVIQYNVEINDNAVPDQTNNNELVVNFENGEKKFSQTDDGPDITNGGAKFVKIDSTTKEELSGAKFKVRNSAGLYAKWEKDNWQNPTKLTWGSEADATVIETDDSGQIFLRGFEYAKDYVLVEIAPPNNYMVPLKTETTFEVKKGSYTITELSYIENTKDIQGKLPLTGGIGLITLVVIGGTLMGASALKKKED